MATKLDSTVALQTAQIAIHATIVGILIDKGVITAAEAARRFRSASEQVAVSDAGLASAEIVRQLVDFVEHHHPEARAVHKPS